MQVIIGVVVVFVCVFGGYIMAGGKMAVIIKALPIESFIILGSGIGAFVISNKAKILKGIGKDFGTAIKGTKWNGNDYLDLLKLMFTLLKIIRTKGMLALEPHFEDKNSSDIFSKYPKILADKFTINFICDTLRLFSMNMEDPHQIEANMENQLEKHHHEALMGAHAVQGMADALPALGIVAAVLGVIKTMSSVTEPPEILGAMIAGALVGTFFGVFMAYGLVGPLASRITQLRDQDHQFYLIIRDIAVSHLHGQSPQVAVEVGRGNIPSALQPEFAALEEALNEVEIPK